jgi:hypothetical protein
METRYVPIRIAGTARRALAVALVAALASAPVAASTFTDKAKESGCVNRPQLVAGDTYKCETASGAMSYFNVPGGGGAGAPGPVSAPAKRSGGAPSVATSTPSSFPRVDPQTQRGRDDVRRKVLADELATEEKLALDARTAYADGAPAPLPDERTDAEKYRARIAKLRQAVNIHEKNVEALKKELAAVR